MNWLRLPPAGRPVPLRTFFAADRLQRDWSGWDTTCVRSGTEALGLALRAALKAAAEGRRKVILPAYACPNLVAAAVWAGAEPVYAEISEQTLALDRSAVRQLNDDECTALVMVDPFGIDVAAVAPSASPADAFAGTLVHDLAQSYLPASVQWRPSSAFSVLSFGRAKPLGLGAGGALIQRSGSGALDGVGDAEQALSLKQRVVRALAYNVALRPIAFAALSRIPSLQIGVTRYEPLDGVARVRDELLRNAQALAHVLQRRWQILLNDTQAVLALAQEAGARVPVAAIESARTLPLWRVPVLMESPAAAQRVLERAGHLGVSGMYGRTLPEFLGISSAAAGERWPVSFAIARRLITLPSNGSLDARARDELRAVLAAASE